MIRWSLSDNVAILTLDRGGARNAIAIGGWEAIAATAAEIAASGAHAVVVQSAMPGMFSAGADLSEFRLLTENPDLRTRFREAMKAGIEGLAALPMPVIAAVDGGCFGAAVALTLACDIVVAGDAATFATTPAKLGLSYPASDVARLQARVGRGAAALMLFTGDRVSADAALQIGLAQLRVNHAAAKAHELARAVAANVPGAIGKLKQVLRNPDAPGHDTAFDDAFGSPAFAQRLGGFLDGKR